MHKNAIKIVWGVKNCALFTKNMAPFGEKKFVRLFVRFLAKLGAPSSSEHLVTLPFSNLDSPAQQKQMAEHARPNGQARLPTASTALAQPQS